MAYLHVDSKIHDEREGATKTSSTELLKSIAKEYFKIQACTGEKKNYPKVSGPNAAMIQ